MSKKTKISLIISCIMMTLVLAGGIIWFVSTHRNTDDESDPETIFFAQNTHEESSADPKMCLQTEAEIIASTISERIEITEAAATEPVQVDEVTASADTPDTTVTIKENDPILVKETTPKKEESSKAVNNPTTDNKPATTDVPTTEKPAGQAKTVNPVSEQTDTSKKPTSSSEPSSSESSSTKTTPSGTTKITEPQEEITTVADKTKPQTEAPTVDPPITKNTDGAAEKQTETSSCSHKWVWATHLETKNIPAVTHEEPVYDDGWDEAVTVQKIYCPCCTTIYEDLADYNDRDLCYGNFGHITVIDHYIHHEPELLFYDTITDVPEHKETITVNDYQYCSICGERK